MFDCRTKWDEWRNNRILAEAEFYQLWRSLAPVIDEKCRHIAGNLDAAVSKLKARKHVVDAILDLICDGDEVYLAHGVLRFADRDSLWTLINEILVNEDYYFETDTDTPRILDCGASYGMALYYFKCLYPKARITAFEPVPRMRELAIDNMRRNGFHDVEVLPYALSDREENGAVPSATTLSRQKSNASG